MPVVATARVSDATVTFPITRITLSNAADTLTLSPGTDLVLAIRALEQTSSRPLKTRPHSGYSECTSQGLWVLSVTRTIVASRWGRGYAIH